MRVFQEEILGPVVSVTTFKDEAEALAIANDTMYGLGAGVWTRDGTRAYRFGRAIEPGRVWGNNYDACPAHAAFGGYKQSGIGREMHKMMLDHYQQTKKMPVRYNLNTLGFFWVKARFPGAARAAPDPSSRHPRSRPPVHRRIHSPRAVLRSSRKPAGQDLRSASRSA